jgi:hypothetical protein
VLLVQALKVAVRSLSRQERRHALKDAGFSGFLPPAFGYFGGSGGIIGGSSGIFGGVTLIGSGGIGGSFGSAGGFGRLGGWITGGFPAPVLGWATCVVATVDAA